MKTKLTFSLLLLLTFALCGCTKAPPDPRIAELEKKLDKIEARLDAMSMARESPRFQEAPKQVTRTTSDDVDVPKVATGNAHVISVATRVTEQNQFAWYWGYILNMGNTNEVPISFDATLQFLDKDGFVVHEGYLYSVNLAARSTNKITGSEMMQPIPASKVKTLKVITALH